MDLSVELINVLDIAMYDVQFNGIFLCISLATLPGTCNRLASQQVAYILTTIFSVL